jgi:hypothetical protein
MNPINSELSAYSFTVIPFSAYKLSQKAKIVLWVLGSANNII